MPRPKKCRWIQLQPDYFTFKPRGVPLKVLQQNDLEMDELEAIRLADLKGLTQEEAAKQMNISRATFGRIVSGGRKKIADALVNGKAIHIHEGTVKIRPAPPPGNKGGHRYRRGM